MSQRRDEDPEIAHLRWVLDYVLRTLGDLTHKVGRIDGRLSGLENEAINRVKDLEGRERERDRRPAQPSKLEIMKVLPWREIIVIIVLLVAGLFGHATGQTWVDWALGKRL
jgi:hypothetical protein